MNYNEIEPIVEEIKKRTQKQAFSLKIMKGKTPGLFDSKFGGTPYWDIDKEYPVDSKGNKLMLLAQINFDNYDFEGLLPERGILQFYTGLDDVFGADFDIPDRQDAFRVVYHENVDYGITEEKVLALSIPTSIQEDMWEYTPVCGEFAIEISKIKSYLSECDYQFEQMFKEIAKEHHINIEKSASLYSVLDDKAYDKMVDELSSTGHSMLAYPFFTQTDPRLYDEKYRYYDTVLFQMDSDFSDGEDMVLWGDCGVGNFFINSEDLKRRDFGKVFYNWDCC